MTLLVVSAIVLLSTSALVTLEFCISCAMGCCAQLHFFFSLVPLTPLAILLMTVQILTFYVTLVSFLLLVWRHSLSLAGLVHSCLVPGKVD